MTVATHIASRDVSYWRGLEGKASPVPRFTDDEMREILRLENFAPLRDFIVTFALVFVPPVLLYFYPSIWMSILGALINVHVFNRCAQIVHGSDHGSLFASKKFDRIVGQIAGCFVGYQAQGHKETHDEHHVFLNSEKDADRIWCEPEAGISAILKGWARDLFLVSAAYRFLQYIPEKHLTIEGTRNRNRQAEPKEEPANAGGIVGLMASFLPIVVTQLILLGAYIAAARFDLILGVEYYVLVFILALLVLYPIQIRLRSNVEHSFVPGYQCVKPQDRRVVRSVRANLVERLIVAPLNYEYHYEHHIIPNMPYYNSPRMRAILQAKGIEVPIAKGYVAFIWQKWLAERDMKRQASMA